MKQVVQNHKTGEVNVEEVPPPTLRASGILVRNSYSLISSGTERSTVNTGQSSLLSKARSRPDLVEQVFDNVRREGVLDTYHKVMNRLEKLNALGYSSAGVVIGVSSDINEFKPGDRVACAGNEYASHAEVVFIPKNLCIPVPPIVNFREAAFTTLGAIAMQAIRQAEVSLGDCVTVIGLGLVGLLTLQILKAHGCRVIGLDINPDTLGLADELGADKTILMSELGVEALVASSTHGYGTDRVIITASTGSNQPIELAGKILRDRGIVVVVGGVRMDIPRNLYYEKELTLKLSRSYGPGRYDRTYEEKGIDYPIGYIRWTEKRNMLAFLQLVAERKIDVEKLVTHIFSIREASQAYELITGKIKERYLAVLIDYDSHSTDQDDYTLQSRVYLKTNALQRPVKGGQATIGFIGAGNFAQSYLLPFVKKIKGVTLHGVATARGLNAHSVARKFGFAFSTADSAEILKDSNIDCIFIATRHNLHASLAVRALEENKYVFVEKPLALSEEELISIISAYSRSSGQLMVGFNRRFSHFIAEAKKFFEPLQTPLVIQYRVNAGFVPHTHWAQDPYEGGGRIIGEVCHFIDTIQFLTQSNPVQVYAEAISSSNSAVMDCDNLNISIKLHNGSLATITYTSIGDPSCGKERIEIYGGDSTVIIDDFRTAEFFRNRKAKKMRCRGKGHREEIGAFIAAVKNGLDSPIPFRSLVETTMTTFSIIESLKKNKPIEIKPPEQCVVKA